MPTLPTPVDDDRLAPYIRQVLKGETVEFTIDLLYVTGRPLTSGA